jgi:hypothetical protein
MFMLDRTGLKNALARLAAGVVFICVYFFIASEISTLANQVIIWITGMIFTVYGFMRYRELQTAGEKPSAQQDPQKHKSPMMDAIMIPLLGILIIVLYYLINPALAFVFYWIAGLLLCCIGLIRCIKIVYSGLRK